MSSTQQEKPKMSRPRRILRWGVIVVVALIAVLWLAAWLVERSLRTPAKKRALQTWLDDTLNADVFIMGDMVIRLNLLRNSRLVVYNTEIDHPNSILFPAGKFARIDRVGAWVPPWSIFGAMPGHMRLQFTKANFTLEQNSAGEWSHEGIMRPLASGSQRFPFPLPRVSSWRAFMKDGSVAVRRRGLELKCSLNAEFASRVGRSTITFHADTMPFSFGRQDAMERDGGTAGPVNLRFRLGETPGEPPRLIPGRCDARVRSLPVATLPFFIGGIPMEEAPGAFHGLIRYDEFPGAEGVLFLEGELSDIPLAVFGLPRNSPIQVTWPVAPAGEGLTAGIRMGPSGFGAFEITIPLDADGAPRLLAMRGDYAVLDDVPAFFTRYLRWPYWLSRTFPAIEWRTGKWRGFGWSGDNMRLSLSRSTAGMNLTGEAGMMGGRVRIAMTPDQRSAPITIAAERLDPRQLSARLSQMLPDAFRISATGSHVNLTWRAFPSPEGGLDEWGAGMVWSKPVINFAGSGAWWRGVSGFAGAVAGALPEWGGGDPAGILAFATMPEIQLDQLSIVIEREESGEMSLEYRAYGDSFGQATGIMERRRDGAVEGEFLLAGASGMLDEVARVNPSFAVALDLLANETPGLRVSFRVEPGAEPVFDYPFLDDARRVHSALTAPAEVAP